MVEELPLQQRIERHYTQATDGDLLAAVLRALEAAGADVSRLRYEDLGGLDHFHGGGLDATRALARLGELRVGERVLDMGGGFGGPARTLATEYGCRVTVLDPTESFIRAGAALTERVGLQAAVTFQLGSGSAMPFADTSFDVVWTQNACMNIPDKRQLVREQRRVLRPGGRLVFAEIFAGPGGAAVYPTPWARDPSTSFLIPPDEHRRILLEAGFEERAWLSPPPDSPPAAGGGRTPALPAAAVVHGADAAAMDGPTRRNAAERRVIGFRGVFARNS
jgi:SAM-dependent methyltransferase